jgi:hypothetical protein
MKFYAVYIHLKKVVTFGSLATLKISAYYSAAYAGPFTLREIYQ